VFLLPRERERGLLEFVLAFVISFVLDFFFPFGEGISFWRRTLRQGVFIRWIFFHHLYSDLAFGFDGKETPEHRFFQR